MKTLEGAPICLKKIEDLLFVAFTEGMITIYTINKLNIMKTIMMPSEIGSFESLYFEKLGACKGFVVALRNKELRIYGPKGNTLINTSTLEVSSLLLTKT